MSATHQGLLKDVSAGSGAVLLDRDGLPHFTGEEKWLDEFEERARGYYFGRSAEGR